MGRMTRAKAAEVAERMHIDEDAVLDLSNIEEKIDPATPGPGERAVLGNIAPNSADSKKSEVAARKTRSKKKEQAPTEAEVEPKVGEQEEKSVGEEQSEEDALEATTNETMERLAKLRITSFGNQPPSATPQSENDSSIATLGQVAEATLFERNDAEAASVIQAATPTRGESSSELPSISIFTQPASPDDEISERYDQEAPEPPSSPVATAVPKVIKSLRRDSPTKRSTSNKENVEPIEPVELAEQAEEEQVAVATTSPISATAQEVSLSQSTSVDAADVQPVTSSSPRRRSVGKSEDSIEALDAMDEAVEKVNLGIANANSPERKPSPKPSSEKEKTKKTKPAPVVRMTKAAAARLSMAQAGNKDNSSSSATARPRPSMRPSTVPGSTNGVRQSVAPAITTKPLPKPKTATVIPHSKPRPVSLSFPTPPPAAKSSKAPTKSSFQLPGEAVAAKLKAAREERLKREAAAATSKANAKATSEEKKPAFKARPVPSTLKKTPSVRHTAASRARESMMTGETAPAPKPAVSSSTTGLKRSNTVGSTRPRPSLAPTTSTKPSQPAQLTVQKRARPSSVYVTSSEIAAAAPRQPSSGSSRPSIAPTSRNTSGTSKGKEVFARFSAARNAAENEKKEKEDAARKARAAAAERGRAASREWAEKQKVKKMIAKVEGDVAKA